MILYLEDKKSTRKIYLTESQVVLLSEASMSLDDVYKKHYEGKVDIDTFKKIVSSDPTFNQEKGNKMGKFGKWLLSLYVNNNLKLEDLYKATQYLSVFVKYSQKIEDKDINHYKSLPQLYTVIEPFLGGEIASSKSEEIRKIKEGAEKVYEDDSWMVIIPHTKEAAIYYGKGTQWCTAAETSDNYFDYYNNDGCLYININKRSNKKYQFHFESEQFMDETDNPIDGTIFETIGASNGLRKYYLNDRNLTEFLFLTFGDGVSELYDANGRTMYRGIYSVTINHSDGSDENFICKLQTNGSYQILDYGDYDPRVIFGRYIKKCDEDNSYSSDAINLYDLKEEKCVLESDSNIHLYGGTKIASIRTEESTLLFDLSDGFNVIADLSGVTHIFCVDDKKGIFFCYKISSSYGDTMDAPLAIYSAYDGRYLTDFIFKGYMASQIDRSVFILPMLNNENTAMLYYPYYNIMSQDVYEMYGSDENVDRFNRALYGMPIGKTKYFNLSDHPLTESLDNASFNIILESQIPEMNEIGMIEYSCDFDEEYYQEWLEENGYENSQEVLLKYYQTEIEYEIELFDSEYYHHMDWVNMYYDDICDEFNEEMANRVIQDCMEDGHGQLETLNFICDDIDVNNPEELNAEAMKILKNGRYFKGCRGYILSNGVVVYTEQEHSMASRINGVKGTFHFISLGNIRVLPNGIDVGRMPTKQQEYVLMKVIQAYKDEELYVDCTSNGEHLFNKKYIHPTYEMVIRDIYNAYN